MIRNPYLKRNILNHSLNCHRFLWFTCFWQNHVNSILLTRWQGSHRKEGRCANFLLLVGWFGWFDPWALRMQKQLAGGVFAGLFREAGNRGETEGVKGWREREREREHDLFSLMKHRSHGPSRKARISRNRTDYYHLLLSQNNVKRMLEVDYLQCEAPVR